MTHAIDITDSLTKDQRAAAVRAYLGLPVLSVPADASAAERKRASRRRDRDRNAMIAIYCGMSPGANWWRSGEQKAAIAARRKNDPVVAEKNRASARAYYDANKSAVLARGKSKRDAVAVAEGRVPGKCGRVAFRTEEERADVIRSNTRNYRARKKQAVGKHSYEDVQKMRVLQKDKCLVCLEPFGKKTPHVDHYIPLKRGGSNEIKNLRLLCGPCNTKKNAQHPLDFGRRRGLLVW